MFDECFFSMITVCVRSPQKHLGLYCDDPHGLLALQTIEPVACIAPRAALGPRASRAAAMEPSPTRIVQ